MRGVSRPFLSFLSCPFWLVTVDGDVKWGKKEQTKTTRDTKGQKYFDKISDDTKAKLVSNGPNTELIMSRDRHDSLGNN